MFDQKKYESALAGFKQDFVGRQWPNEKYKWEAVKWFQDHWDVNAPDFAGMLAVSLKKTYNLLVSRNNFPRGMIEDYAKQAPEDVRAMFIALFDETTDVWERIDAFKRKSDELKSRLTPDVGQHYHTALWNGGEVYVEDEFPNLLFAADGSFFSFDGVQTFVMGGAYSVDKDIRLARNWGWWPDEQPDDEARQWAEQQLEANGWRTDIVLTHTTPLRYEPVEVFMSCVDQSRVDKSTEEWLDTIEQRLCYKHWYCGHYHTEKTIDRMTFMFESIRAFPAREDLRDE